MRYFNILVSKHLVKIPKQAFPKYLACHSAKEKINKREKEQQWSDHINQDSKEYKHKLEEEEKKKKRLFSHDLKFKLTLAVPEQHLLLEP